MYRDFSEKSKNELLALVAQVEDEKLCDFTDWLGDRWYDFESWIGKLDIKNYLDNVNAYHKKVIDKNNTSAQTINAIFEAVEGEDTTFQTTFTKYDEALEEFRTYITGLSSIVAPGNGISISSSQIEFIMHDLYLIMVKKIQECRMNDEVYNIDSDGHYGGDQGSPRGADTETRQIYSDIIYKNTGIRLTTTQLTNYLNKVNSEGCGYVALVNTIFCYYQGRSDDFYNDFGYSMYTEDGNLNFDTLLIDIYSRMDNRDSQGNLDIYYDYNEDEDGPKSEYNYLDDSSGTGTTVYLREYYLETFMEEHGINVKVEPNVNVTTENVEEILWSGKQIIIALRWGNLYNMDGSIKQTIRGGHAMTVVGVTEDGMLIVSSWGGQYYIDPNETVTLYDNDGNAQETSITFSTVEYLGED